jgi:DNA polymerase-3 subunit epsilon
MLGSTHLIKNPSVKFLRLEQLYQTLFKKTLENPHDALVDAKATALCFFELLQRKEIDENAIEQQQKEELKKELSRQKFGCYIPMLVIFCLTILIFYCL